MHANESRSDHDFESTISRGCSRPIELDTGLTVRCGSRIKSKCPSCAELYRGDWAAIARSGVFDGPVENYRFYLMTLTAPSFGRVHRVPKSTESRLTRCGCGITHGLGDGGLRGVPLNPATYDYQGQVSWNRDSGVLWDRTRRRMRDRWNSTEYFVVREWQERGVLHVHALVRIARSEAPNADALGHAARTAVAVSKVDGSLVEWGSQVQCDAFRADGDGARAIWYLSKALNYVMKDTAREGLGTTGGAWKHVASLSVAARAIRCSPGCTPSDCCSRLHARYGSRSHVVSASRRTKSRTGWSFTGLTRGSQRRMRAAWARSREQGSAGPASSSQREQDAITALADFNRRVDVARAAVLP